MIEVRELTAREELKEAVRLQKEIWGFADIDCLPLRLFVVASNIGGLVLGAFEGLHMVGFALALPAIKPGGAAYLHSNMMGVVTAYRSQGVGRQLKVRQRDEALKRGIGLIEWTFDPLELKNAFFNIVRLGAVIRRYVLNAYGTTSSHLHSGLPTDRCIAEWHLGSARVELALGSKQVEAGVDIEARIEARIEVPADIARMRAERPELAREIQARMSAQFTECFAKGLAVTGFERTPDSGVYLLSKWQSE